MKEYLKLAAVALIAGLVAGLVVGWLVSNQPAVLGNTRFPNGLQTTLLTVTATSTNSGGDSSLSGAYVGGRGAAMNNSSTTLCSFRNPIKATTSLQWLYLSFNTATSVPTNIYVATTTVQSGTTTLAVLWSETLLSGTNGSYSIPFVATSTPDISAQDGTQQLGSRGFVLGTDEYLNVVHGGTVGTRD